MMASHIAHAVDFIARWCCCESLTCSRGSQYGVLDHGPEEGPLSPKSLYPKPLSPSTLNQSTLNP